MTAVVRPRRPDDVPALARVLAEQQPTSRYPLRWPLPFPLEEFVARDADAAAWVLEVDGELAGHVAVGPPGEEDDVAFRAVLDGPDDVPLGLVTTLFTGTRARGTGGGGALLDAAVGWVREQGWLPVLDVLPVNATALAVYRHRGWTELGRTRPSWLPDDAPDAVLMVLR